MEKFVVMISGANRGIGFEIAKTLFQEEKFHLSLGIRDLNSLNISEHFPDPNRVSMYHYDAQDPDLCSQWIENTLKKFSQIDCLVNNSGILRSCGIDNYNEKNLDDMWLVNTKGPITLTQQAWEYLKQSKKSRIINIVSIAGKTTRPDEFGYNLTKHALLAFTHSIRQAGWDDGIRATAICPGWVNTQMATSSGICGLSSDQMTQPVTIAELVKMAIELPNTGSVAEIVVNAQCGQFF